MTDKQQTTKPDDDDEWEVIHEHRKCDAPMCRRVVTHWAQRKGYVGPVYCQRHADMAKR